MFEVVVVWAELATETKDRWSASALFARTGGTEGKRHEFRRN